MNTEVLPVDNFIVVNKTLLSELDRNVLVMLYQPLIGFSSIGLYFTLWSYLNKTEIMSKKYNHYSLLMNMKASIIEINEARKKLEAIGLLKTYLKKGDTNCFVYEIYSPLSANDFFNNPLLSTLLYSNVGKENYEDSIEYFAIPTINLAEYDNITAKFNEVFAIKSLNNSEYNNLRKISRNIIAITSKIDLLIVLELIPDEVLNKKKITNEIKDLIINLSFVYDFNNEEIKQIILNSINDKKQIDKELLRETARKYYQFENNGKLPNIVYKNQPEYLKKDSRTDSKRDKMIYQFEVLSPYDFLSLKYKDTKPTKTDLKIIESLLVDLKLTPAVVNVLVDYVLRINNNKLTRSYVETIAGQWKRENIKTAEEAMSFAEKEYKKKTKKTTKTKVQPPKWIDEKIEETTNEIKQKELEEMLKEYR